MLYSPIQLATMKLDSHKLQTLPVSLFQILFGKRSTTSLSVVYEDTLPNILFVVIEWTTHLIGVTLLVFGESVLIGWNQYNHVLIGFKIHCLGGMKRGSFFISLTRRLPIGDFEVVECNMYPMSWGDASIFIMQKVTESNIFPSEVAVNV